MDEASFKDKDEKVLYYTGLSSWELLEKLFSYIKFSSKQQACRSQSFSAANANTVKTTIESFRETSRIFF